LSLYVMAPVWQKIGPTPSPLISNSKSAHRRHSPRPGTRCATFSSDKPARPT
jgi:hypothetical protein